MTKQELLTKRANILTNLLNKWRSLKPLTRAQLATLGVSGAAGGGLMLARSAENKALENEIRRHQYDKRKGEQEDQTLLSIKEEIKKSSLANIFNPKAVSSRSTMPKIRNTIFRGGQSTGRELRTPKGIDKGRQIVHKGGVQNRNEKLRLIGMFGLEN